MIGGREGNKMPCESCAVQFSVFKRKRACCECERYYCSGCLRRGGGTMCAPCRVLSTRPLSRSTIAHLKVRDLQCFLQRQNVSTRGCVEKEELVSLCVSHVNSSSYRRRGQRAGASPFSSLKGFTNNINDFINSAFDLRNPPAAHPQPPPAPRGYTSNCFNSAHAHASPAPAPSSNDVPPTTVPPRPNPERFTTRPGGEPDIRVPVPETSPSVSRSTPDDGARVDTADCFEIEDLDDSGWEFITSPADPLPNGFARVTCGGAARVLRAWRDCLATDVLAVQRRACPPPPLDSPEVIMIMRSDGGSRRTVSVSVAAGGGGLTAPAALADTRAASELDLNVHNDDNTDNTDSNSLQDEQHNTGSPKHISLEQFKDVSELEVLNIKQLKELLTRNRVEYRGCLERADLLERAKTLWNNHQQYKDDVENLPIEECCKICMAAPLECVLLECGHIAACTGCSKQLAECPICRQYVVRAVRFFRS